MPVLLTLTRLLQRRVSVVQQDLEAFFEPATRYRGIRHSASVHVGTAARVVVVSRVTHTVEAFGRVLWVVGQLL